MKEMKEKKVMEVIEKDINSFSELVLILGIVQASNTINEIIKVIIEDNFNKEEEEETEKEKIKNELKKIINERYGFKKS